MVQSIIQTHNNLLLDNFSPLFNFILLDQIKGLSYNYSNPFKIDTIEFLKSQYSYRVFARSAKCDLLFSNNIFNDQNIINTRKFYNHLIFKNSYLVNNQYNFTFDMLLTSKEYFLFNKNIVLSNNINWEGLNENQFIPNNFIITSYDYQNQSSLKNDFFNKSKLLYPGIDSIWLNQYHNNMKIYSDYYFNQFINLINNLSENDFLEFQDNKKINKKILFNSNKYNINVNQFKKFV